MPERIPERIFIAVAWPYANGPLHLGHIAGCYLSADIFARYHRMKGNDVLMVSGSDTHGTPITIRADQEGITPQEVVERYHAMFLEAWQKLGITFDLFTTTNTANHEKVVHDVFKTLHDKGYIYTADMLLAYCAQCVRYLPDRYVEGTCPYCQNPRARGDQCDSCGRTLDPQELVEPRCAICGATPEFRESEHFFLKLSAFEKPLLEWVEKQTHWRPNVLNFTRRFLQDGLKDRSISRDLTWGVPLPMDGYDSKRIYVWFEAVIGYLSAAVEWAEMNGKPDAWEDFWKDPATKSYYFIGKDNIPFHSIIWPAIILAYDKGLNLPYDVPANEFLSLENQKFSTSQNWAVWLPDYLERYDPDPCATCCPSTCRSRGTPISPGPSSSAATTMNWWRPTATWSTGCFHSPTGTSMAKCLESLRWTRLTRACSAPHARPWTRWTTASTTAGSRPPSPGPSAWRRRPTVTWTPRPRGRPSRKTGTRRGPA